MKIDYADALKKGLRFCMQPKRWLPFLIIDLAFLSISLALILANIPYFMYLLLGVEDMSLITPALSFIVIILVLFIAWILVGLWITGSLIHQSHREKEFNKSWRVSGSRYLSMLGVSAVAALLAFATFVIPYVGWIASIAVGLAFFFAMQAVIISGDGFIKALGESWKIFTRQPFKVFLMWLVISGISLFILLISAIPIFALLFNILMDIAGGGPMTTATVMSLVFALQNQLVLLVAAGIIFTLGVAIARVFSIKAQTEFYGQIKKKHSK